MIEKNNEKKLFRKLRSEDITSNEREKIVNRLIEKYQPLVISILNKYFGKNNNICREDLIQAGNIGLLSAIRKYNFEHSSEAKFITYAYQSIKREMQQERDDKLIRIPEYMNRNIKYYKRIKETLWQKNGCKPTIDEIAKEMHMSKKDVNKIRFAMKSISSLEQPIGENEEFRLGDTISEEVSRDREKVQEALSPLTVKEVDIVKSVVIDKMPLKDVAKKEGVKLEKVKKYFEDIKIKSKNKSHNILHLQDEEKENISKLRYSKGYINVEFNQEAFDSYCSGEDLAQKEHVKKYINSLTVDKIEKILYEKPREILGGLCLAGELVKRFVKLKGKSGEVAYLVVNSNKQFLLNIQLPLTLPMGNKEVSMRNWLEFASNFYKPYIVVNTEVIPYGEIVETEIKMPRLKEKITVRYKEPTKGFSKIVNGEYNELELPGFGKIRRTRASQRKSYSGISKKVNIEMQEFIKNENERLKFKFSKKSDRIRIIKQKLQGMNNEYIISERCIRQYIDLFEKKEFKESNSLKALRRIFGI